MIKFKIINFCLFFFILNTGLFAEIRTNLAIFDSLANGLIIQQYDFLKNNSIKFVWSKSVPSSANKYLIEQLSKSNITFFEQPNDSCKAELVNYINDFSVHYEQINNNATLWRRVIKIKLISKILINDLNILKEFDYSKNFQDTINISEIQHIENHQWDFTSNNIHNQELSFWDEYFQPLIITASAVATVILFFSVRSK